MMSGRDEENISADMLTMDELRIIALYLSNFYIPFGTSLDGAESRDTSKENCKTALINLGFDKDLAEEIVEMVMAASLSSASQLYIDLGEATNYWDEGYDFLGLGTEFNDPGIPIFDDDKIEAYVSVLNSSWNGSDYPLSLWSWNFGVNPEYLKTSYEANHEHVLPIYYIAEGERREVFEFNSATESLWNAIMRNADYSNGMAGNAMYGDVDISSALTSSDSEILARVIFTQPMYVDWVGNIICDCGDERVIVLPACMNPYVFSRNDTDLNYNFNAVSTFGMSILQDNRLFSFNEDGEIQPHRNTVSIKEYTIKLIRGSRKDASWDTIFWIHGKETDGGKALKDLLPDYGISIANDCANSRDRRDWWDDEIVAGDDWGEGGFDSFSMEVNPNALLGDRMYLNDIVYFNSEVSHVVDTNSFNTVSVFDLLAGNGETKISPFSDAGKFNTITGNSYHNFINFSSPVDLRVLKSIFVTYTFAYCNAFPPARADAEFSGFTVNMTFNDIFPKVEGYLQFNHNFEERQSNERAEQVLGEIYWLLHPLKGIGYASTLFKRKIGGILVSWHEDIVGATSSNYTTGSTHYLGSSLMIHIKPHR